MTSYINEDKDLYLEKNVKEISGHNDNHNEGHNNARNDDLLRKLIDVLVTTDRVKYRDDDNQMVREINEMINYLNANRAEYLAAKASEIQEMYDAGIEQCANGNSNRNVNDKSTDD